MNAFVVFGFAMCSTGPAFSELGGNWAPTSKPLPALLYLVLSRRNVHRNDDTRVLNATPAACFSTVFTATNCMVGRDAASAIASASAASFLFRFTNGFT